MAPAQTDCRFQRVEGPARKRVIAFMQAQFRKHFDARIDDDTDEVYALIGADGGIEAAFGLNRNPDGFFCRHYVGDVQRAVQRLSGAYGGHRIVELSHLCVRRPATLCRYVGQLAAFLWREADYLICTVTRELAHFFNRKGLTSCCAAYAQDSVLPPQLRNGWGTYYDHRPRVLLGNLADACRTLGVAPVEQEWLNIA